MARRQVTVVVGLMLLVGGRLLWDSFARYSTFHNRTFDLAFYARLAWGMAHGHPEETIVGGHFAGLHCAWVLVPLGLLGRMLGTVPVLLCVQALAVTCAAWPFARLGARRLGPVGGPLGALAWLLYPNLGHVATYEFHPGTLAVLPFALALERLERGAVASAAWLAATLPLFRADLAAISALFGLSCYWLSPRPHDGSRRLGLGLSLAASAYGLVYLSLLHPRFAPAHGSLELHFGYLQQVPLAEGVWRLLRHVSSPEQLLYPCKLLLPLALLPLLGVRWLLPALPVLAINLASAFPTTTKLYSHYLTPALPALVAAALVGAGMLQVRWPKLRGRRLVLPALLGLSLGVSQLLVGGMPWSLDYPAAAFRASAGTRANRKLLSQIPALASVQAPDPLLPHLAERPSLFRTDQAEREVEYTVLGIRHRRRYARQEVLLRTTEEPRIRAWLARNDHAVRAASHDFLLFERGPSPRQGLGSKFLVAAGARVAGQRLSACLRLRSARLAQRALRLELVAARACPSDLALRFGATPKPSRVELLFDGLLCPAHLAAGDVARTRFQLEASEAEQLARRGLFVGVLRSNGRPPEPGDPFALRVELGRMP